MSKCPAASVPPFGIPPAPVIAPDAHKIDRRKLLGTLMVFASSSNFIPLHSVAAAPFPGKGSNMATSENYDCFAYVGCRTTRERNARGDGINVYLMKASSGLWTHVQLLDGILNPSFLAIDRNERFLYTVHGDSSEISSFKIDPETGKLRFLNKQSTQGKNPVHLAFDASGRFIVVANHITSSLAVLPVNEDGSLGEVSDLVVLKGKIGPHRVEQPFAKPHQIVFDKNHRFMIVPDKGLDCVFTFSLDEKSGKLLPADPDRIQARETSGPRHAVFHPSGHYAYVINELDSTVTAYSYSSNTGRLEPLQILSALPDTFTGDSRASEIAFSGDGKFLYASNRGHDSIAIFAVATDTGRMKSVDWVPAGKTPRFFAMSPDERFVYVANEDADTVIRFDRDSGTGMLNPTNDVVNTGSPVCILFKKAAI